MRSRKRLLILSTLAAASLAACSSDVTNPFAPLALSLSLTPSLDTIFVSDTLTAANSVQMALSAKSLGSPVTTPTGVEWSSSNPNVVSISSAGLATAQGIGSATITARINSSTATANIVVVHQVGKPKL